MKRKPPIRITKTSRAWSTYQLCHGAWRARAIGDFRYGTRSDDDDTVVWQVDGIEWGKTDLAGVEAHVRRELAARAIVSVELGPTWLGYQSLAVTFTDGVRVVDRMTSAGREISEVAA